MRSIHYLICTALVLGSGIVAAAATNCEDLAKLSLPDTTVTMAVELKPGAFVPPPSFSLRLAADDIDYRNFPAVCRVAATIRPTNDSVIKMEVLLPLASAWNGKFMALGNGGQAGQIYYHKMGVPLSRGYAVASTDTGHEGTSTDGTYALGHPEKVIDFGYRAVHEMTLKSKAVVAAYYGRQPTHSYWFGCSTGGRQGLKEIQLYPNDFDGVIAGAPGNYALTAVQSLWVAHAVHKEPGSYIPPEKYPAIHNAVLRACDARDGVKDGVLENPAVCKFDPSVLQCKGADGADCLTGPQVEAARKIYSPALNVRTKKEIIPGFAPGSEMGWGFYGGAEPSPLMLAGLRYRVFKNPSWDYKSFNFDSDIDVVDRESKVNDATDPNLKPFFGRGGKLLQYHGWNDNLIPPQNSINYFNQVVAASGGSKVNDSYRLFMVPGMAHCRGGDGTDRFDSISALEQWVEKGKAPESMVAAHYTGETKDRTRPLCAYPKVAVYSGTGSTDDATNFSCK